MITTTTTHMVHEEVLPTDCYRGRLYHSWLHGTVAVKKAMKIRETAHGPVRQVKSCWLEVTLLHEPAWWNFWGVATEIRAAGRVQTTATDLANPEASPTVTLDPEWYDLVRCTRLSSWLQELCNSVAFVTQSSALNRSLFQ